jgi:hypothetical protein
MGWVVFVFFIDFLYTTAIAVVATRLTIRRSSNQMGSKDMTILRDAVRCLDNILENDKLVPSLPDTHRDNANRIVSDFYKIKEIS